MPATRASGSLAAASALALAFLVLPVAARAQYMYLDSNGDGVHTAADALNPSGTTQVDVWIRTDHNRDGSAATCVTGDGDLTINSYTFILHAENGTVGWGTVVNQVAEFDIPYALMSQGSDLHAGYASGNILPAGNYRLATVPITVASGTPSVRFATSTFLGPNLITSFGSQCSGVDFDNTMKLGQEWSDTDGLPFGGIANRPPVLDQPADMTVMGGQTADQALSASDPDGQPLSFFRASGPAFIQVSTTSAGTGHATGNIHLAPSLVQGGSYSAAIGVSDGITSDQKPMHVDVQQAPTISFGPIAPMTVDAYSRTSQIVLAQDLENRPLEVSKAAGPGFMNVADLGLNRAEITLEPSLEDAGTVTTGTIAASNGLTVATQSFPIIVNPLPACAPGWCTASRDLADPDERPVAVGAADLNGDSRPDLISGNGSTFYVRFGRGNGTFFPPQRTFINTSLGFLQKFGIGDLNGDGRPDLVATLAVPPIIDRTNLVVYYSSPGGTFNQGPVLANGEYHDKAAIGDLNRDGRADVVAGEDIGRHVAVFLQNADGTFAPPANLPATSPNGVAIEDFDGDGKRDIAAISSTILEVFPGNGDGTFGAAQNYTVPLFGGRPLITADFNRDGRMDLATVLENSDPGGAAVMLNQGAAGFRAIALRAAGRGLAIGSADWNRDGYPDLVVGGINTPTVTGMISVYLGDGDGTFSSRQDVAGGTFYYLDLTTADWNGDGAGDVTLCNFREMPTFLTRAYTPLPNRPPVILAPASITLAQGGSTFFFLGVDDPDDDPLPLPSLDLSLLPRGLNVFLRHFSETLNEVDVSLDRPLPAGDYPLGISLAGTSIRMTTFIRVTGDPAFLAATVVLPNASRAISLTERGTPVRIAVEPVNGSFRVEDVTPGTVLMHGTSLLTEIVPLFDKGFVTTDLDHDGVMELELTFARGDLSILFGDVRGRTEGKVWIEGRLADGKWFQAPGTLTLVGKAPTTLASTIAPNPLNPDAVLRFDLPRTEAVRIDIFDPAGRKVRTVLDQSSMEAGTHDVQIDGRDANGGVLPSGVYFYRIETAAGRQSGRFAILK